MAMMAAIMITPQRLVRPQLSSSITASILVLQLVGNILPRTHIVADPIIEFGLGDDGFGLEPQFRNGVAVGAVDLVEIVLKARGLSNVSRSMVRHLPCREWPNIFERLGFLAHDR
jgi:hypothetical protein